jgi:hypothetical protein
MGFGKIVIGVLDFVLAVYLTIQVSHRYEGIDGKPSQEGSKIGSKKY